MLSCPSGWRRHELGGEEHVTWQPCIDGDLRSNREYKESDVRNHSEYSYSEYEAQVASFLHDAGTSLS